MTILQLKLYFAMREAYVDLTLIKPHPKTRTAKIVNMIRNNCKTRMDVQQNIEQLKNPTMGVTFNNRTTP